MTALKNSSTEKLNTLNGYFLIILGFFIPISTALTSVMLGLILLVWFIDNIPDRFQKIRTAIKKHPVAIMGLFIFLLHIAGIFYTIAGEKKVLEHLSDGTKFLFIPMMMIYYKKEHSDQFMLAFVSAMILILGLSYLFWMGLLPNFIPVSGSRKNLDFVIFHDHIKQNIFMAYTVFVTAVWARFKPGIYHKLLWGGLSSLAFFNVFFMVLGRTGHLILAILILYFSFTLNRKKGLGCLLGISILIGITAWAYPSSTIALRAKQVISEVTAWKQSKSTDSESSSGLRLEWYLNTAKLISKSPLIGTGTGSFRTAYHHYIAEQETANKNIHMNPTDNPHNEYLMTAVQFGILGLSAFLAFFGIQWTYAGHLKTRQQTILARGFVLTILCACLVSSPIQDNAEGWFFAYMSTFLFIE